MKEGIEALLKIDKLINYCLILLLFISLFNNQNNDRKYYCVAIGVDNDSTIFYLAVNGDNDISIEEYRINEINLTSALSTAKDQGYNIDLSILKEVFLSVEVDGHKASVILSTYKDLISSTTLVYRCDLNILFFKDHSGEIGISIIPNIFDHNKGGSIFLDIIYKRKSPPVIIYDNDRFNIEKYE